MKLKTLDKADLAGKKVLLRLDLNLPYKNGEIQDYTRLNAALPTLMYLIEKKAKIIVLTHFGRPKGKVLEALRVDPIAHALSDALGQEVLKMDSCLSDDVTSCVIDLEEGQVCMLENTRFHPEESTNDKTFCQSLAALGDLYVNDAFGAVHRDHATTSGLADCLPSYAGLLIQKEVEMLESCLKDAKRPLCLIVGGAKIDTKIGILENFLGRADHFLLGGALANTFLAAQGYDVGDSLFQEDKVTVAQDFMLKAQKAGESFFIPKDVIVADEVSLEAKALNVDAQAVEGKMKILDIGLNTAKEFAQVIAEAGTIIWNGPMGLYEFTQFGNGTLVVAEAIAQSDAVSVVGGGDSIDAISSFGIPFEKFTHISTGGGAMLEFLEGKELVGLRKLYEV
jgi:phosphoglycerate kinase